MAAWHDGSLAPLWQQGVVPAAYVDIDPHKIGNRVQGIAVVGRAALPPLASAAFLMRLLPTAQPKRQAAG